MAEVIEVKPKGIYVKIEFSLEELIKLKKAFDHCEITVDLNNPEEKDFHNYFVKEHSPLITQIVEDLTNGSNRTHI